MRSTRHWSSAVCSSGLDYAGVIAAARKVNAQGVGYVLVTLGAAGALLVTETGAWIASPPPIEVASTVGAEIGRASWRERRWPYSRAASARTRPEQRRTR